MKPKEVVNLFRLIGFPVLFFAVFMVISGGILYTFLVNRYQSELIADELLLAESFSKQISLNYEMRDNILKDVDDTNLSVARLIMLQRDLLSNEYLAELTEILDVDDIWWYNSSGEILYDANLEFIGWTPTVGDPIYNFMHSGLDVFIEDIRVGTEDDRQYKNVYVRAEDGFVQVATRLETIQERIISFQNQLIIEKLILKHNQLHYILIVNTDFVAIADTDIEDIGIDYSGDEQYTLALSGTTNGIEWYYDQIGETVFEVATPIYYNDQIIGLIGIGISLSVLNSYKTATLLTIITIIIVLTTTFVSFQLYFIRRPLSHLGRSLINVDYEIGITKTKGNIFEGLYVTVNQFVKTINDNNKTIQSELNKSEFNANHDFLTNLLNRRGFISELNEWVKLGIEFMVCYIDLDNFKHYNDLKGHDSGDRILFDLSNALKNLESDLIRVSRLGGDEFAIGYQIENPDGITNLVNSITDIIGKDITIDLFKCYLTASMGISVFPQDGQTIVEIIENSEKAMNEAKKNPSTKIIYYNQNFKKETQYITEIVERLKDCIAEDGFEIVYQPQVNSENETILALEALLRMKDSKLLPGIFIPIAEKNGLMNRIGRIVIAKVIEQIASWSKRGFQVLPVYINFSSTQLHDQTITTYLENLLIQYKVNPSLLGVEITEDVFIEKKSLVVNTLKGFKKLGLHTAIDDFGAGQAGVNYLTNFEVDLVKIDKAVADKFLNEEKSIVYSTVVKLCTSLGFQVLAEGIETKEQINYLNEMGVTLIQGFYYYKPLNVKDIESKLNKIQKIN